MNFFQRPMSDPRLYGREPPSVVSRPPLYWEAAVLGIAFLALVLGSVGLILAICHKYLRHR